MDKENYFIIRPFGPSIVKLKMPENLVNKLNTYVDKIIGDEERRSVSFNARVDNQIYNVYG